MPTGQSLYALGLADVKDDAPVIQAARRYLLTTQKPDGGWSAPTKKAIGGNQISSYWGSAWAVIGLARTCRRQPNNLPKSVFVPMAGRPIRVVSLSEN